MADDLFPKRPDVCPKIYAYEDTNPQYFGLLKIGYTTQDVSTRVAQQYPTLRPGSLPYRIVLEESAMRNDGTVFDDRRIHEYLRGIGIKNPDGEWFQCNPRDVLEAVIALRERKAQGRHRMLDFKMRPEQLHAVEKTASYFKSMKNEKENKTLHFLWNAKMRFGKTFAAYQLAKKMGWEKVLVLTFKPAVQNAWKEDLESHIDFSDWQFISPGGLNFDQADLQKPIVCFGSFQDYLGRNPATGGIKTKNERVHSIKWDCVILDEYHYGAWRENAKELFEAEDKKEIEFAQGVGIQHFDESIMPITTKVYLYLSGTPFKAISSGEFIEEQIFNWTYSDEQRAKAQWQGADNPYTALPRMVLLTYQMPSAIRKIAMQGEFNEFDLNSFFEAEGAGEVAKFIHENEVQKWLDLIRGSLSDEMVSNLRLGIKKPPMPFSDVRLLNILSHTMWFLPSIASCFAMKNLLKQKSNRFYHDYRIIVAAGNTAGIGAASLPPVHATMDDPLKTKTITLSCGKLTTGVTVRPWSGIFILRNCSSPETYFQAAFRVQSPWTMKNPDGIHPNVEEILKEECYVFDFAPDRALRQIADYSCRLNVDESNPEQKIQEFIEFLPVLAYDGASMKRINAMEVLDMAMSGTTSTLLARRWESALLVNVDNSTLERLMNNKLAMAALMKVEGFRNLNRVLETIINKSNAVKKARRAANGGSFSQTKNKKISKQESEYLKLRKQVQSKLVKFATRIPVFMYLTDYRERTLKDVIMKLEPTLFKKVTGLTKQDFELLVSLGVFNSALMNDAVYKFKRYEDSSLEYIGINKHSGEDIGLYDTVLRNVENKDRIEEAA